jgi:hypothetical protein
MAEIALGIATSHSPMLNTNPKIWPQHVQRDLKNGSLWAWDGKPHTYDELVEMTDPKIEAELTPDAWMAKHEANQRGIAELGRILAEVNPDVIVAVGDDQKELFHDDNMPAMLVYWGETIWNKNRDHSRMPPDIALAAWGNEFEDEREFPAQADLGLHIIKTAVADKFDVAHSKVLPNERGEGHAFGFVRRRLLDGKPTPIVPIVQNTFYPPNQPLPERCFDFGESVRGAIESWDSNAKVCVLASGGLSHFVVDENLDRGVIKALAEKDHEHLKTLPTELLNAGNSEIRNWITMSAMVQDKNMKLVEYVPCYRSPASTGGGWAFAYWD